MIIGLTGGIGSGKSAALLSLKEKGYKTVSCDDVTRELYKKRKTLVKLKREFPSAIKGRIFLKADKKEISRIAFSNERKYAFLNEFLTRETFDIAYKRAEKLAKKYAKVIVEVPLLFENKLADKFDKVIVITREKERRIASVKARSHLSEAEISARIDAQFNYDNADLSPFTVIKNDGEIEDLAAAVIKAVKSF